MVFFNCSDQAIVNQLFQVPVFVTEQNPRALGSTVAELDLAKLGDLHVRIGINRKISLQHTDLLH
jgi:hypothetical protein